MRILLVGTGANWGLVFTKYIADQGHTVDLVTSKELSYDNVNVIKINWDASEVEIDQINANLKNNQYDIIFFNQNSYGVPSELDFTKERDASKQNWNNAYWINCQLPYYMLKGLSNSIHENTKIGWMLTGLIDGKQVAMRKYAGYASVKSTNLHLMRGFSLHHPGIFFCINPIWFPKEELSKDAEQIFSVITKLQSTDNGKVFNKDGNEWDHYRSEV